MIYVIPYVTYRPRNAALQLRLWGLEEASARQAIARVWYLDWKHNSVSLKDRSYIYKGAIDIHAVAQVYH